MKIKVLIRYLDVNNNGKRTYTKKPKSKFSTKVIVLKGGPWYDRMVLKLGNGDIAAFKYNEQTLTLLKKITSEYFTTVKVYSKSTYSYYLVSRYSKMVIASVSDLIKQFYHMDLVNTEEYWQNKINIELWRE